MKLFQAILKEELIIFDKKFKQAVKSQASPLLDRIMRYIVKRKGKQLTAHVCLAFWPSFAVRSTNQL